MSIKSELMVPVPNSQRTSLDALNRSHSEYMRSLRAQHLGLDWVDSSSKDYELISSGVALSKADFVTRARAVESRSADVVREELSGSITDRIRRYAIAELSLILRSVALQKVVEEEERALLEEELEELERFERMQTLNAGAFA